MSATHAPAVRSWRAGGWAALNIALGSVFQAAFLLLAIVAVLVAVERPAPAGMSPGWAVTGAVAAAVAAALMTITQLQGLGALRPVRLTSGPAGATLSIPVASVWGVLRRIEVPVTDVAEVRLGFHREPRNSRWRLEVVRADGSIVATDSVSSARSPKADPSPTAAGRAAAEIRAAVIGNTPP